MRIQMLQLYICLTATGINELKIQRVFVIRVQWMKITNIWNSQNNFPVYMYYIATELLAFN